MDVSRLFVALFFGLWSGSQVFLILESAMNLAWHTQRKRPYWARRGLAILMLIFLNVVMTIAVLLANVIRFLASVEIPLWGHRVQELPWLVTMLLTILLPVLIISSVFAMIPPGDT